MTSKITNFSSGLESLSYLGEVESDTILPEKKQLRPDGEAITIHLDQLFDLYPTKKLVYLAMAPRIVHQEILNPKNYKNIFETVRVQIKKIQNEKAETLSKQLDVLFDEMAQNQAWLDISLRLLLKA